MFTSIKRLIIESMTSFLFAPYCLKQEIIASVSSFLPLRSLSITSITVLTGHIEGRQFVKKNTKWMHIDIAGPSYKVNDIIKYASPEASGVGVRLLFDYFD